MTKPCPRCSREEAEELHTCPYSEEISDDYETLCECCAECTHECCMDI